MSEPEKRESSPVGVAPGNSGRHNYRPHQRQNTTGMQSSRCGCKWPPIASRPAPSSPQPPTNATARSSSVSNTNGRPEVVSPLDDNKARVPASERKTPTCTSGRMKALRHDLEHERPEVSACIDNSSPGGTEKGGNDEEEKPLSQRQVRKSAATSWPAVWGEARSQTPGAVRSLSSPARSDGKSGVSAERSSALTSRSHEYGPSGAGGGEEAHLPSAPTSQYDGNSPVIEPGLSPAFSSPSTRPLACCTLLATGAGLGAIEGSADWSSLLGDMTLNGPSLLDGDMTTKDFGLSRNEWNFIRAALNSNGSLACLAEDYVGFSVSSLSTPLCDFFDSLPLSSSGSSGIITDMLLHSQQKNGPSRKPTELCASSSTEEPASTAVNESNRSRDDTAEGPGNDYCLVVVEETTDTRLQVQNSSEKKEGEKERARQEVGPDHSGKQETSLSLTTSGLGLAQNEKQEKENENKDKAEREKPRSGAAPGLDVNREEKQEEDDEVDPTLTSARVKWHLSQLTQSVSALRNDMHKELGTKVHLLWNDKIETESHLRVMRQLQEKMMAKNKSLTEDLDRVILQVRLLRDEVTESLQSTKKKLVEASARESALKADVEKLKGELTMLKDASLRFSKHAFTFSPVGPTMDFQASSNRIQGATLTG